MLLRLSSAYSRLAIAFASFLVALTLSYFSIRQALASYAAERDTLAGYERAVRLEPANPQNWYLLGHFWESNLENPDPQRANSLLQKSLSLDPHSADAWLDLGSAYEELGETAEARSAYLSAKKAYPSSATVAWRYGNFLLRRNELPAAFAEMHHAIEQDPKRGAEAFSRCWRVDPDVEAILDKVIPPSKQTYLAILRDLAGARELDPALAVWKRLVALHPSMSPQEIGAFANALLQGGRYADVRTVWQQAVSMMINPPPPDPPGSVIWDGSFESGLAGDGLEWQFPRERHGVRADFDPSQHHSGAQSLRLLFTGKENANYADACHQAIVQPGASYRLSAWVRTQALTSNEGIRLRLLYFDKTGFKTVETADVRGSEPWTNLTLTWTAPPESRSAQVCIARRPGDAAEDNIQGSAWIDDVSLVPVAAETSKP